LLDACPGELPAVGRRAFTIFTMDVVSAKVCGTIAIVLGVLFLLTSAVRLTRSDPDVVLIILNSALGILALIAGGRLWWCAHRKAKADVVDDR
jgi:hypothetical protein